MSNDRLIGELVAALEPVRTGTPGKGWLLLGALGAAELALFLVMGQARPDLGSAMTLPSFWWKIASLAILTVLGVVTAVRSFDPAVSPRPGLAWMVVLLAASLVAGWVVDAAAGGGGDALLARLMWREGLACVFTMAVLSIPPLIALGLLMRRGASTDLAGSALAVGSASAAWGAFIFVFNCPHDDPLYVAAWYLAGSLVIALSGRVILPGIARW